MDVVGTSQIIIFVRDAAPGMRTFLETTHMGGATAWVKEEQMEKSITAEVAERSFQQKPEQERDDRQAAATVI
jgi:hypothetical protein